jgi:hypothetical protein
MLKIHSLPISAVLIAAALLCGSAKTAQAQDAAAPSVAEAARRSREQKKTSGKPVKTLTDDNLPAAPPAAAAATAPVATDATASPETAKSDSAAAAESATAAQPASAANSTPNASAGRDDSGKTKESELKAALERAKKELAVAEHELDVVQRKAVLDSDSHFSKADYDRDEAGKAVLAGDAKQAADKQKSIEMLKAKLTELKELLGKDADAGSEKNPPKN